MYTQQQITNALGKVILFCGVETASWGPGNFGNVATFCKQHGIDSVLVKVNDGANVWYGGIGGFAAIRNTFLAHGVGCIPYGYCYGNKFGGLSNELAIAHECLQQYGYYCMDMEAEYDGELSWAHSLASSLGSHPGILLCSTWADPALQNWMGVLSILASTFDAFLPQEYTNYLDSTEYQLSQAGVHTMAPTIYLGADMPGNNAYQIARDIHNRGHSSITLWYDGFAINNPALVDFVVSLYRNAPSPTPQGNKYMDKQFTDVWALNQWGLPANTGIGQTVKAAFDAKKITACYPTSHELATVDWSGASILYQTLSNGYHAEYSNGHCNIFAPDNTRVWG